MVDIKYGKTDYMVNDKTIQIIYSNLSKYVNEDNAKCYVCNNSLKYVLNIKDYHIEILYFFIDKFYRISVETRHNNQLQSVTFLTRSKMFHQDIKKALKKNKLTEKSFENHMLCFASILNEALDNYGNLNCLEETYIPNLKYDGVFI